MIASAALTAWAVAACLVPIGEACTACQGLRGGDSRYAVEAMAAARASAPCACDLHGMAAALAPAAPSCCGCAMEEPPGGYSIAAAPVPAPGPSWAVPFTRGLMPVQPERHAAARSKAAAFPSPPVYLLGCVLLR